MIGGKVWGMVATQSPTPSTCKHPGGCDKPVSVRGWCVMHYRRLATNGHPGGPLKSQAHTCTADGCGAWVRFAESTCPDHRVCDRCGGFRDDKGSSLHCASCYVAISTAGPCRADGCVNDSTPKGLYCADHRGWTNRRRSTMQSEYAEKRTTLLAEQGGRCAICGTSEEKRWDMDHDHSCCGPKDLCDDCVRGVLCRKCNRMVLGGANDDLSILRAAVAYLETHSRDC